MPDSLKIKIIDYQMGNLTSVYNAFQAIGSHAEVIRSPDQLNEAEAVVLPGVGAFGDGMENLRRAGWIDALNEAVLVQQKPFLGICVGMQLLSTSGTEHGFHTGLGWIPGVVDRMRPEDETCRIPHIGWNEVVFRQTSRLFEGLGEKADFYFVHSFVHYPDDPSVISGTSEHGMPFAAAFEHRNICATQFHPEKSQKSGLQVLKNFLKIATSHYA